MFLNCLLVIDLKTIRRTNVIRCNRIYENKTIRNNEYIICMRFGGSHPTHITTDRGLPIPVKWPIHHHVFDTFRVNTVDVIGIPSSFCLP